MLKSAVSSALNQLLAPVQAAFQASQEWQEVEKQAYPPPPAPEKKKKEKKVGSRYPGAAGGQAPAVEAKPDGHVEGAGAHKVNVAENVDEAIKDLSVSS